MNKIVKLVGKKVMIAGMRVGKKVLSLTPGIREKLKIFMVSNINISSTPSDSYQDWVLHNVSDGLTSSEEKEEIKTFKYLPLISIIVPTYNTPEIFIKEMIMSVVAQTYENWEMVLVDDASTDQNVRMLIRKYAKLDKRITYKFLEKNHHIAGATNEGIKIAKGEYISLLDHDDILWSNALFEIVRVLNDNNGLNFIYTDEDKISGSDRHKHFDPFFKPDWNPDFLRSVNYITHFTTMRKELLDKYGYEDGEYNGAQDWELFLRITRNIKSDTIHHIPKVLYSWRVHEASTAMSMGAKPYVIESQQNALKQDAKARGFSNAIVKQDRNTGYWAIQYKLKQGQEPLVSIVIPTKNQFKIVKQCIDSIIKVSTYKNFEVVIVDTGSDDERVLNWYKSLANKYKNIKIESFVEEKFSFARSCNFGASIASGEYLLMLNNDIEVTTPDWIQKMVGFAQRPEIGAVGVKLLYPDRQSIQHAGVGIGMGGCAANLFTSVKETDNLTLIQSLMLKATRNVTAVTAACVIFRKSVFDEVGGFKDKYRINYNDVDLCLRIVEAGYNNVYLPDVSLIHYESISRGIPKTKGHDSKEFEDAQNMFKKEWWKYIERDPNLNPNFRRDKANLEMRVY